MKSELEKLLADLVSLFSHKKQAVDELLALTRTLGEVIETGDTDQIGCLLERRQRLMDQIDQTERDIKEVWSKITAIDPALASFPRPLQELDREIRKTGGQILELEPQNKKALEQKMAEIKAQIKKIADGKRAATAYGQKPVFTEGIFFEKKR